MATTLTANLSLEKPANGDDVDTWDIPVNANSDTLDAFAGGVTTFNLVSATGVQVLTSTQYIPRIWKTTGALTANVNLQLPAGIGGMWSARNACTGAFTVTVSSATGGGTSILLTQGSRTLFISDGTNLEFADSSSGVPSGGIIGWSGSIATIPSGYHLADGTSGTINLTDQFLVGAGNTYTVGQTGGTASQSAAVTVFGHVLVVGEMPAHSHVVNDPTHVHGLNDPTHNHTSGDGTPFFVGTYDTIHSDLGSGPNGSFRTSTTANSATGITMNAAATGITLQNTGGGAAHTHTASIAAWDNRPPFYAIAFIQKL